MATIVHVEARVAIMNNGATKGGTPPAWQVVHSSPGIQDVWQVHRRKRRQGEQCR